MYRFYLPKSVFTKSSVTISDAGEIHHLKNVLRLKSGNRVSLFNGQGKGAIGLIENINESEIIVKIKEVKTLKPSFDINITLACAIPKKAKFETIIEKTTELGINEIIPLRTKRTEVILKGERGFKKQKRYQTVAINAAKQSKRGTVPAIHDVTSFSDLLGHLNKNDLNVIPCLSGRRKSMSDVLNTIIKNKIKRLTFIIGPEGDFTPSEVIEAKKAGCVPVSLGETTLKVDTAAISVVGFTQLYLSK